MLDDKSLKELDGMKEDADAVWSQAKEKIKEWESDIEEMKSCFNNIQEMQHKHSTLLQSYHPSDNINYVYTYLSVLLQFLFVGIACIGLLWFL